MSSKKLSKLSSRLGDYKNKDRDAVKTIRFTTVKDFWVQPFEYTPVWGSERAYKIRTHNYLFRGAMLLIAINMALFLAAIFSRSDGVFTAFVAILFLTLAPYAAMMFAVEFTVIDRSLLKALASTFEFKYFVGLTIFMVWPAGFDVMFRAGASASNIAAAIAMVIFGPLPFIWVELHDASIRRFAGPTGAMIVVLALAMGVFYVAIIGLFAPFNAFFQSSEFCLPPGSGPDDPNRRCSTILETFTKPVAAQLLVFFAKYVKHLFLSPTTKMVLVAHLTQENRAEHVSTFKHVQDPDTDAVVDPDAADADDADALESGSGGNQQQHSVELRNANASNYSSPNNSRMPTPSNGHHSGGGNGLPPPSPVPTGSRSASAAAGGLPPPTPLRPVATASYSTSGAAGARGLPPPMPAARQPQPHQPVRPPMPASRNQPQRPPRS